eukprot:5186260-Prymnesium_polylepis.1
MPENRPELLLEMVQESGTMGPRNIVWLRVHVSVAPGALSGRGWSEYCHELKAIIESVLVRINLGEAVEEGALLS